MAKVYFFNGGSHGHTNPTLGMVAELVSRGEEVIYYSTPDFRPLIEQTGATFRLYPVEAPPERPTSVAHMLSYHLRYAAMLLPDLITQAEIDRPDYILFDIFRVWGWHLGKLLQIPTISTCPCFAFTPAVLANVVPNFSASAGSPVGGVDYFIQHAQTTAQIKKAFGIDSPALLDSLALSGDMMLVFTTPTFQPAAHLLDKSVRFVGPSIEARPQASDFPVDHLREQPVVFISLGTVFDNQPEFYQNCFTAFADSDCGVVMTIGNRINRAALGEIPANFIVRNFVPQLEILKHTDVFITHGGLGSVHEALYFGVPMVLFPQMFEQSVNAQRVAQCGAGLPLRVVTTDAQPPAMVSPHELRHAVEQVLENPRFKWNAQRVGEEFLRYNPVNTAEIVQQFVGTPLPMRV